MSSENGNEREENSNAEHLPFEAIKEAPKPFWKNYKIMIPVWLVLLGLIWLGIYLGVDKRAIAGVVFLLGLLSNAFVWLMGLIAIVPVVGPLIVKALSLSVIWLLNAFGYAVSFVAIKRGYSKDVITYRGLTVALIVGIVIGYVLGKIV